MSRWIDRLPFRIGTTSYIVPDDILPNVRYLAGQVRDIELVLFDIDEYCNIPDPAQAEELKRLSVIYDLSYTVHLPLNLNFSESQKDISIEKAMKVINGTRDLEPFAYVCHLECKDIPDREGEPLRIWQKERILAVDELAGESGLRAELAVENLETYPIDWNEPVIHTCGTHACLDIGHLFLQKTDPIPVMRKWLPLTSVIHLHGIGTRDHQSLRHMAPEIVKAVMNELTRSEYQGVLTLEVFNEEDFLGSMEMIRECL
ncbi:MAG: sugar phosphate isomerase/epimerase [Anaerolineaceae bacterium]|nr:sugar phosphate isomerase/epimerase [Anaerolineaceae bacterium]